eukprot:c18769_g1_i1.p1 GENE.c18769_g1_i1~~c18769_g1_i1.p1  ORF type:complete len:215 (-),score=85.78 c18769_g1_i1:10-654(-)
MAMVQTYWIEANITFSQVEDDPFGQTSIVINGKSDLGVNARQYFWAIRNKNYIDYCVLDDAQYHSDPACNPLVPEYCSYQDLEGKNGKVLFFQTDFRKSMYSDFGVPLTGNQSVKGKELIIYFPKRIAASCADIFDPTEGYPVSASASPSPSFVPQQSQEALPENNEDEVKKMEALKVVIAASCVSFVILLIIGIVIFRQIGPVRKVKKYEQFA